MVLLLAVTLAVLPAMAESEKDNSLQQGAATDLEASGVHKDLWPLDGHDYATLLLSGVGLLIAAGGAYERRRLAPLWRFRTNPGCLPMPTLDSNTVVLIFPFRWSGGRWHSRTAIYHGAAVRTEARDPIIYRDHSGKVGQVAYILCSA